MSDLVIKEYIDLCDQIYTILLKENSLLKQGQPLEDTQEVNDKKTSLLERLSASVADLKALNEKGAAVMGPAMQQLIQEARNRCMKMILLDRENESLMHDNNFEQNMQLKNLAPSRNDALKAYASGKAGQ